MKILNTLIALIFTISASAQIQDFQFGKPAHSDLEMMTYGNGVSPDAVILYDSTSVHYEIEQYGEINQYCTVTRRIKILQKGGLEYANVQILLYHPQGYNCSAEKIEAISMNLENGKTSRNSLKKNMIFKERISDEYTLVKFAVPNAVTGSIIDYKYTIRRNLLTIIPGHRFQHDLPVRYSCAEYAIPGFFIFNVSLHGKHPITTARESISKYSMLGSRQYTYAEDVIKCHAADIPATDKETHIWYPEDYISKMEFELDAYQFPSGPYTKVSTSWESVSDILKNSKFSTNLAMSNPLSKEMQAKIAKDSTNSEKIRSILELLHSSIRWNGDYSILSDMPKSALKERNGNSAEINFILNSMLRDAGFNTEIILLNPRSLGRMSNTPTLKNINHFVLRTALEDGTTCYLDGTNEFAGINLLPDDLLVENAHLYGDYSDRNINIAALHSNNTVEITLLGEMDSKGNIKLDLTEIRKGMCALDDNMAAAGYSSEMEYLNNMFHESGHPVKEIEVAREYNRVKKNANIEYTPQITNGKVYLSPIVLPFSGSNPFVAETRQFPIEFDYPVYIKYNCNITLPDNIKIESIPDNFYGRSGSDKEMTFNFEARTLNNMLQTSFRIRIPGFRYKAEDYGKIKQFFTEIIKKTNDNIVFAL